MFLGGDAGWLQVTLGSMRFTFHSLCAVTLALVLALTSQSMAVVRGASAATGQIDLCIGDTVITVYTDAEGKPTKPPHACPDCLVSLALSGAAPDFGVNPLKACIQKRATAPDIVAAMRRVRSFAARAPPV